LAEAHLQLNLAFLPIEDRLLLRIASGASGRKEEYRLLLTRRLVRLLWDALTRLAESYVLLNPHIPPEGKGACLQFQQTAALSQADFETPYTSEKVTAPLGPAPLLIYKFQASSGPKESRIISLGATTGQVINLTLSLQLIHSFRKLLADMNREAGWDLHLDVILKDGDGSQETLRSIN